MRRYLDDEGINIARGLVSKTTGVHVNGSVPNMSQNKSGTIWDKKDTNYPWSALASANNLAINVSNASDLTHAIVIYGLDANRDQISESVTLSAQTGITTTKAFHRINSIVFQNGSATQNVGNIDIKNRVGGKLVARIRTGNGTTQMAIYSVPNGHEAYITQGVCSIQEGADATGKFFIRQDGLQNFILGHTFEVAGGGEYQYKFTVPFKAVANSDVDVRATVRSNNARVTAAFDVILIDTRNP